MASKQQKYAKLEAHSGYTGLWKTDLSNALCADPCYCCFSVFCSWCASYQLRKRALHNDMTRYLCCNGDWPCSGRCGEQNCPECCLCTEVFLCFPQSVASTRWMLQDEMRLRNTQCDNCIIGTMFAAQYIACLCWIAACISGNDVINDLAILADHIADILWCSVCACLQTQHKVQLDERDRNPAVAQPYAAPAPQAMMHGGPPPPGYTASGPPPGYYPPPPPQQQGYGGYPPPQQGGYAGYPPPAQGYPPPAQGYPPPQGYASGSQYPPPAGWPAGKQ